MRRIFIVAGEASGDLYGGQIASALRALDPDWEMQGWGGEHMEAAGVKVTRHYRELAYMGFWEVLKNLRTIRRNLKQCEAEMLAFEPDLWLGIDFPGFNLRVAAKAKAAGVRTYHVISPQVWAWRPGRIHGIVRVIDRMHVVLPFEEELYRRLGADVRFVGHPLLDVVAQVPAEAEAYVALPADKPLLAFLPGSRSQELQHHLPLLIALAGRFPDFQPVIAGAPGQPPSAYAEAQAAGIPVLFGATHALMRRARAGVVTSGTATLEAGLFALPQVVMYRTSGLTYAIARRLARVDYISLPNLLLGRRAVPERIQQDCTVEQLERDLRTICEVDAPARTAQLNAYDELAQKLGTRGAADRIAESIAECPARNAQREEAVDRGKRMASWGWLALWLGLSLQASAPPPPLNPVLAPVTAVSGLPITGPDKVRIGLFDSALPRALVLEPLDGAYQVLNRAGQVIDTLEGRWSIQVHPSQPGKWEHDGQALDYAYFRPLVADSRLRIDPAGPMHAQHHPGGLHVLREGDKLRCILDVALDDYLVGVLSAEAGKGHHPEFYRAQAIVSRTYTLTSIQRHAGQGFNLCDAVHCQAYHGISNANEIQRDAVRSTSGLVLLDRQGAPITAAFHSNCGGQTQGAENVWQRPLPYLVGVQDTFCLAMPHCQWEKSVPMSQWEAWLQAQPGPAPASLQFLPTDRVNDLPDDRATIRAAEVRKAFALRSSYFVTLAQGDTVRFIGKGFGHGVGMCQEGAMNRARHGATAHEILHTYYSGVKIADLHSMRLLAPAIPEPIPPAPGDAPPSGSGHGGSPLPE